MHPAKLIDPLLDHMVKVGGSGLVIASGIRPRLHVDGEVISIEGHIPIVSDELEECIREIKSFQFDNKGPAIYELNGNLFTILSWKDGFGTTAVVQNAMWVEEDDEVELLRI